MSNISKFNNQLKEFVEDLRSLNMNNIEELDNGLYYLKFNSKLGINMFRECILDDDMKRIMIFKQNDSFFLSQNENYYNNKHNVTLSMINEIKEKWKSLENIEKQKIWNYLKILIYFSDQDMGIDTVNYNKEIQKKYLNCVVIQ